MSSRRSRASRHREEDEINNHILKLQAAISQIQRTGTTSRASASKILKETCNFIKKLHREMEDLSERLSVLMASIDTNSAEAEVLISLLMQR
ncbi:transcription factor ILI3-like [Macadamia integrifolia]|uniref:transcription factor ILI3-like n=1 Tax=Macadamia integrifolia TaxID=60698 RepID=UPI001C4E8184|nr:transcription factor ILI3-like [Macadamia integrifolia]